MRISDWSSDVCSSDLLARAAHRSVFGDDSCQGYAFKLGDRENILVTATGQVDDDAFADTESRRKLLCVSDGVRRLQRRNDASRARQLMECGKRLIIGRRHVLHAAAVLQPRVCGTDDRIGAARREQTSAEAIREETAGE